MAMVHAVENDTHALVRGDKCADTQDQSDGRQGAVASAELAEREKNSHDQTPDNRADAKRAGKEDAGRIAVAYGPAHEIWMSLSTERGVDRFEESSESTGVGGVGERIDCRLLLPGGKVELSRRPFPNVSCNDPVDLFAEWLNRDCKRMSATEVLQSPDHKGAA